jgi:regulatory protein
MTAATEVTGTVRISGIVPDPHRPGAVRVHVGGRALLTVPREVVARLGIEPGLELDSAGHLALCQAADAEAAYRTALQSLGRRPYAAKDLARRLVMRGHPPGAADGAVDRARAAGLIDDDKFARHFIETRSARGRGPARLRRELVGMGVSALLVDRILSDPAAEQNGRDAIATLIRKRAAQLHDVPRPERIRRVIAYLARRGYTGTEVRRQVREMT